LEKNNSKSCATHVHLTDQKFGQEIREISKANAILDQINLPWESLFDSIEHAATEDTHYYHYSPTSAGHYVSAAKPRICRSCSIL
jgi:hypothetical protein